MTNEEQLAFVVWMVRIGQSDRELYRQLRSEAWEMVAENHRAMTPEERSLWLKKSS